MSFRLRSAVLIFAALMLPGETLAQVVPCGVPKSSEVSERDARRIAGLEWSRVRGLAAALTGESAEDRQTVSGLYSGGLEPAVKLPEGDYRCRTIKLGSFSPLLVYQFFDCTIEASDEGYTIRKPTGSQRFVGTLTPSGDGFFYRGALYYSYESPIAYDGNSEHDQVGCLFRVSADRLSYVLEMPSPHFSSDHDIIVLVPRE
jgi:hypothetical protein